MSQAERDLESFLAAEREALLNGNLSILPELSEKKSALIDALLRGDVSESVLQRLAQSIRKNHRLIEAARQGVNRVRRKVSDLAAIKNGQQTYGPDGLRRNLGTKPSHHGKRI